jgi:S1-C subfamily serine protease
VALLRVDGLDAPALRIGAVPRSGQQVLLMGYPQGARLTTRPAVTEAPRMVRTANALGRTRVLREVVLMRGTLGPGSSGGPVIDRGGSVVAMIFGASEAGRSGAAVPSNVLRSAIAGARQPIGAGPCA